MVYICEISLLKDKNVPFNLTNINFAILTKVVFEGETHLSFKFDGTLRPSQAGHFIGPSQPGPPFLRPRAKGGVERSAEASPRRDSPDGPAAAERKVSCNGGINFCSAPLGPRPSDCALCRWY